MKILIADDSRLFRDRIRELIKDINDAAKITEVSNGADALKEIIDNEPDLVFLDIRMPLLSGIKVLQKVKELKLQTKIITVTNFHYKQYREKSMNYGAYRFYNKSDDITNIKNEISKILK